MDSEKNRWGGEKRIRKKEKEERERERERERQREIERDGWIDV